MAVAITQIPDLPKALNQGKLLRSKVDSLCDLKIIRELRALEGLGKQSVAVLGHWQPEP